MNCTERRDGAVPRQHWLLTGEMSSVLSGKPLGLWSSSWANTSHMNGLRRYGLGGADLATISILGIP